MILCALDTETVPFYPGCKAPPLTCVALSSANSQMVLHWTEYNTPVRLLLSNPKILLVGHHIAFDMAVLCADDPSLLPLVFAAYDADRITDTGIRAKLADIAKGTRRFHDSESKVKRAAYDLDSLSKRNLNRRLDKNTWRLRYGELRPYPLAHWPEGALNYPKEDVRATHDLWVWQELNNDPGFFRDQFRQARAAFWIQLMHVWGLRTDAQGIFELAEKTEHEYDDLSNELRGFHVRSNRDDPKSPCMLCGMLFVDGTDCVKAIHPPLLKLDRMVKRRATGIIEKVDGSRDTKAAKDRMISAYEARGLPVPLTDNEENPGVSLSAQDCLDSLDPALILYSRLTSLKTVLKKDLPALELGINHPIHSFFETLLESGRVSSSGPNVQNIRRLPGIRECFVPRCLRCSWVHLRGESSCARCGGPVSVFVTCDYGGLELCTLAQVCMSLFEHSKLAHALNNKLDPHMMIASQILGKDYELLKAIKKAGPSSDCIAGKTKALCRCPYCETDSARQVGKVVNFGCSGGLGADALVGFALATYNVRLTVDQARNLKSVWRRTWPEVNDYFKYVDRYATQNPPRIEQLFAGRYRCGTYPQLCNTLFQGLGSDIAKAAGWELAKSCYLPGHRPALFGCRINNFVHDDFTVEAPEPVAHDAAMALRDVMLTSAKPWLPDVRIDGEALVMRRWSRNAKQIIVNGRLQPWG